MQIGGRVQVSGTNSVMDGVKGLISATYSIHPETTFWVVDRLDEQQNVTLGYSMVYSTFNLTEIT